MKLLKFLNLCFQDYKNKITKKPSGISVFCSDAGSGKTISAIEYLSRCRDIFPKCKLYANIDIGGIDGKINSVAELLELPKNSVIFWDELNVLINCHEWRTIDPRFRLFLSQHRHLQKKLISTAQSFNDINAEFRRFCTEIIEVKNLSDRWIFQNAYHRDDYKKIEGKDDEYKAEKVRWKYNFIATDELRACYNHETIASNLSKNEVCETS